MQAAATEGRTTLECEVLAFRYGLRQQPALRSRFRGDGQPSGPRPWFPGKLAAGPPEAHTRGKPIYRPPCPSSPFFPDRALKQERRARLEGELQSTERLEGEHRAGPAHIPSRYPAPLGQLSSLIFCPQSPHRSHQQESRSRLEAELQSTERERRAALQAELLSTQAACSAELAQLQAAGAAEVAARRAAVEAELKARGVAVEAELLRAAQAMEQTERGLVQRSGELKIAQVSVDRVWNGCRSGVRLCWIIWGQLEIVL